MVGSMELNFINPRDIDRALWNSVRLVEPEAGGAGVLHILHKSPAERPMETLESRSLHGTAFGDPVYENPREKAA